MQKRFDDHLRKLGAKGKKILVALSGGQDSTVLLDLLLKSTCEVAIVHANFQLRESESEEDEVWLRRHALELNLPFYSTRFDTNNYATDKGISIQMAARELRYAWFEEIRENKKYDFVATAHHAGDDLETVLLNFVRGTGISGLRGIPVSNQNVIRPLLAFAKEEIVEYAGAHRLKWREDSSNATDHYSRNYIRHHVVPGLKELNPSLATTFIRNKARVEAAHELMGYALEHLRAQFFSVHGKEVRIQKSLFGSIMNSGPVLQELIDQFAFNLDQCFEVVEAVRGQPGKQFLSPTHRLVIDREHLIITIRVAGLVEEVLIQLEERRAELGPWVLKIEDHPAAAIPDGKSAAALDKSKLQFPLRWRKWRPGDSFMPLGMDHKKKLSDFLIDAKVPLPDKDTVTVLESGGEIAWLVGWRIDNRFKVGKGTETVFSVTLESRGS